MGIPSVITTDQGTEFRNELNRQLTALALGVKPELFLFDQSKMRRHLQQCLERGKMQMFPVIKKRRTKTSSVKKTQAVPVYCKCRMPELPNENMIECKLQGMVPLRYMYFCTSLNPN